ncbi:zinc-ribbon-domain-containing protein [Cokeromyces recurvatus]|uniref:zinc-ribbon-domain-containing protein n=1 Tax=Cokeromyces recurvatus TaxID=90255 RepID=UPI00221EE81F|nr:zinc-ribbon-domain-containing protein [Cokeromyces recurvatus]KAI7902171.1 zinc-ribbon-domain-containing protein [Cokeromyces recurvatus]
MNQDNAQVSNDNIDYEWNNEEDNENWQDAEEQPTNELRKDSTQIPTIDETELRKKIKEIHSNKNLTAKEKAKQIQYLMSHGTTHPNHLNHSNLDTKTAGYCKSYYDEEKQILGCKHYQRKCKLQANCCQKIYSCRFCHDDIEDHTIIRNETKNMLCMNCMQLQPAAKSCSHCGEEAAHYYCDKCKLWDNDPKKSIYHCDECGICRQGKGLGQDFFHCKKCNICLSMSMKKHKCIERNLESDCPICGEYMFTSTSTVIFMPCGHCIHKHCYTAYIQTSYQCPTCLKSLGDMSEYFNRLDKDLERQPMPAEYEKYISHIFCNDCEKKSAAKYHFFYHKCKHCSSFNTTVLRTENTEEANKQKEASSSSSSSSSSTTNNLVIPPEAFNSDQEFINQASGTAGNSTSTAPYDMNYNPSSSSSRNGVESNEK